MNREKKNHISYFIVHILFFGVVLFFTYGDSAAQNNFYQNLTDPLAICRIDSASSLPLKYSTGHGYPNLKDTDGYCILAADTGTGVVTHFWITVPNSPDTAHLKLYIDDSLIHVANVYDFFKKPYGLLRLPFVTPTWVANVCDIQMPYKRNFKITMEVVANDEWYAVGWRPMPGANVQSFRPLGMDSLYVASLDSAEKICTTLLHKSDNGSGVQTGLSTGKLNAHSSNKLFSIAGPSIIQKLKISLQQYDLSLLDSVFLDIKWDNAPFSSVHVPLSDFFMFPPDTVKVHSISIEASKDSGLVCYFPMPFEVLANISLENISSRSLSFTATCWRHDTTFDRRSLAYFHADFHETNPTRYKVFHPVLQSLGVGRLVGLSLWIPNNSTAASLEGDPYIYIDSSAENLIHYTGTEDYFDGGFYFGFQLFSNPFSGHTKLFQKFYRFNYLDPIDFKRSIDFEFQHGNDNDVYEDYRSCAYYYKLSTRFWTLRDTIRGEELWDIYGTGYPSNTLITASFDGQTQIGTVMTNDSGSFDMSLAVPATKVWPYGIHTLWVNGEIKPEPIMILGQDSAAVTLIADFLPPVLRYTDTLLVTGTGFLTGVKVSLYLDTILVSDTAVPIIMQSDYRFFGTVHIPNIADTSYHLIAKGEGLDRATSEIPVFVTRSIPFEFENMIAGAHWDSGTCVKHNLSGAWYAKWSRQEVASFDPGDSGKTITFRFFIPVSDTFDVKLLLSKGAGYGNYQISIDGINKSIFHGAANRDQPWFDPYPADMIGMGSVFFAKDTHTISFHCIGRDSAATGFLLDADAMVLKPVTKFNSPHSAVKEQNVSNGQITLDLFPEPVTNGNLNLVIHSDENIGSADITIFDLLGRIAFSKNFSSVSENPIQLDLHSLRSGNYLVVSTMHLSSGIQRISRIFQVVRE
ncbi:MAG: DUF2961 domain-containing protein [Candidatus Kapaibacterium sp.]